MPSGFCPCGGGRGCFPRLALGRPRRWRGYFVVLRRANAAPLRGADGCDSPRLALGRPRRMAGLFCCPAEGKSAPLRGRMGVIPPRLALGRPRWMAGLFCCPAPGGGARWGLVRPCCSLAWPRRCQIGSGVSLVAPLCGVERGMLPRLALRRARPATFDGRARFGCCPVPGGGVSLYGLAGCPPSAGEVFVVLGATGNALR